MKNNFSIIICCLGLLTVYFACEKDDSVIEKEQTADSNIQQNIPILKTVSFEDAGPIFNRLKNELEIDLYLQLEQMPNVQGRSTLDTLGITIYTDNIKEITSDDYTSYTMLIATPSTTDSKFYNLTIENKNGEAGMFVTKYIPTEAWKADKSQTFEGSVSSKRADSFTAVGDDFGGETNGGFDAGGGTNDYGSNTSEDYPYDCDGMVITSTETNEELCGCGHTWQQLLTNECIGCTNSSPQFPSLTTTTIYTCVPSIIDPNNPGDTTDPNNPNSGGTVTSGPTNSDSSGSLAGFVPDSPECEEVPPESLDGDCIIDDYERLIFQLEITDSTDQNFILHNTDIADIIIDHISENDHSNDAYSRAKHLIEFLVENPDVDFEEEMLEIVIEEPDDPIDDMEAYLDCFDTEQAATITISADQPDPDNPGLPITISDSVGHAFVTITQGENVVSFGFYPSNGIGIFGGTDGTMNNDQGHDYDVSITNSIDASTLAEIIDYSISFSSNDYWLIYLNCTSFAFQVSEMSGFDLDFSECEGDIGRSRGVTPGKFGNHIRDIELPEGSSRNLDGGFAPQNNGCE